MWLSLVERLVRDEEVGGSNPLIPTIFFGVREACFAFLCFYTVRFWERAPTSNF